MKEFDFFDLVEAYEDWESTPPSKEISIQKVDENGNIDPDASFSVRASDVDHFRLVPRGSIRMRGPEIAFEVSGNHRVHYGPIPIIHHDLASYLASLDFRQISLL